MCLITNQKEPIILDKDLIGYKTINIDNTSSFMEFQYEENKLYNAEMIFDYRYVIFDDIDQEYLESHYGPSWRKKGLLNVSTGFHFFTTRHRANLSLSPIALQKVIEVTIPAGAKVYFGFTDLAVADTLKTGKL